MKAPHQNLQKKNNYSQKSKADLFLLHLLNNMVKIKNNRTI